MTARRGVRAAIVGAGLMGRWHARAVHHAGGKVVAIVDSDAGRATRLANEYGARVATTLDEAAASVAMECAHICTPLDTHLALARAAVALRIHSLVEKPLVESAAETEEILRLADERRVLVCPVHQFPLQRGVQRVVAALPRIAPVLHVQTIACSAGADGSDQPSRDRVAADILPHPLSLFAAILDARFAELQWDARRAAPGELLATAAVGTTTLSIVVSMSGRPTANAMSVIGAHGTAHVDLFHGFAVIEPDAVSRIRKVVHPLSLATASLVAATTNLARRALAGETAYPGLRALVASFHAAVRGEAPTPIAPERTLHIARARDAILRAADVPIAAG